MNSTVASLVVGNQKSEDPRIKLLNRTIKKEGARPDALIQILHVVQNAYGYLPMDIIRHITREMKLPPSRVFGVVTFYHYFSLKPKGDHNCLICTGTACYVKGAMKLLKQVKEDYGIGPGEVTQDNRLGLQTARCLGSCGLAPAVVMDDTVVARVEPSTLKETIESRLR